MFEGVNASWLSAPVKIPRLRWLRRSATQRVVVSFDQGELAYVQAHEHAQVWRIKQMGTVLQGAERETDFEKKSHALQLNKQPTIFVLRPTQYQLLQIEAPAVPAHEMAAAVRWQIASMVQEPVDELVTDVMPVGDAQVRKSNQVFVVVVTQSVLTQAVALAKRLGLDLAVIDIQDNVQRNLQLQQTQHFELAPAHVGIVLQEGKHTLLTITAFGELQYSRRLESDVDLRVVEDESSRERWASEIQRSLDVWERTVPDTAIRLSLYAGHATPVLSRWLGQYLGQATYPFEPTFEGLDNERLALHAACWPLLGGLLRQPLTA